MEHSVAAEEAQDAILVVDALEDGVCGRLELHDDLLGSCAWLPEMHPKHQVIEPPVCAKACSPHHFAEPRQCVVTPVARHVGEKRPSFAGLRISADPVNLHLRDLHTLNEVVEFVGETEPKADLLHPIERVEVLGMIRCEETRRIGNRMRGVCSGSCATHRSWAKF
ncbi:hypothetical protein [Bosea massiliensis]|uniref:Uncharacterized protein n=1 Tax=Bosea massiliensis TaxID=151419 RepID=A0ABW0PAY3_9HYPH